MKKILKNVLFQILSLVITIGTIGVTYAAWTTLNTTQGATGQPVDQTLMQGVIDNINDLDARVGTGKTTGGTVTGNLRWSIEYGAMNNTNAWNTCLAIVPAGMWRLPSVEEIDYGRRINGALFTGGKWYWSATPGTSNSSVYVRAFDAIDFFSDCSPTALSCSYFNGTGVGATAFRCVSNAN